MIAPLGQGNTDTAESRRRLSRARRLVAFTLFQCHSQPSENVPPIPAWRAWVFAGWVVIATGVYFATMLGVL